MKRFKGSLTLEAVIAFTVFISFMFMLLTVVKMTLVVIALDSVTAQTAKDIAANSYVLGLFNDMAEDVNADVQAYESGTGFTDAIIEKGGGGLFDFFLNSFDDADKRQAGLDGYMGIVGSMMDFGIKEFGDFLFSKATDLIAKKSHEFVAGSLYEGLKNYNVVIKPENLNLEICKLPVPEQTYKNSFKSEGYALFDLSKSDFNEDDVIIGVTYDYKMVLPFLPEIDIQLRSFAIEHAWVNGETSDTISFDEGIKLDDLFGTKHVFVGAGGTGKKYHKETCRTLWRANMTSAISVKEAKSRGLKKM